MVVRADRRAGTPEQDASRTMGASEPPRQSASSRFRDRPRAYARVVLPKRASAVAPDTTTPDQGGTGTPAPSSWRGARFRLGAEQAERRPVRRLSLGAAVGH